jgi:hypothetical protein
MSSALPVQIDFLCFTSAEWEQNAVTRPLAKGELAWEIAEESSGATVYVLKGDGYPPNHGQDSNDYRRLRISPSNWAITIAGLPTETLHNFIKELCTRTDILRIDLAAEVSNRIQAILKEEEDRNAAISGHDGSQNAHSYIRDLLNDETSRAEDAEGVLSDLNTTEKTNLVAAVNSEITARDDAITAHNSRGSEENPDDGVHPYIQGLLEYEAKRAKKTEGDLDELEVALKPAEDLVTAINNEYGLVEGIDGRVTDLEDFCEKTLPQVLSEYAPVANPTFTGIVTADEATFNKTVDAKGANTEVAQPRDNRDDAGHAAPYNNDDNPATVLDWKDLRELTMDVSGKHLIAFDAEFSEIELLLKADKGEGKETAYEYDNAWQEPPITQGQWKELYDLVMSTSGETIAILDEEGEGEIEIRLDRAAGCPDELLEYDANCCYPDVFDDAEWVE